MGIETKKRTEKKVFVINKIERFNPG